MTSSGLVTPGIQSHYASQPLRLYPWFVAVAVAAGFTLYGQPLAGAAVLGVVAIAPLTRWLLAWSTMLSVIIVSFMLIPANLYSLPASLPIDVEIYRLFVFMLFLGWLGALLTDSSIRVRSTFLDVPILVVALAVTLSFVVNMWDFEPVLEFAQAEKAALYVLTFLALFYCIVSVVRDNRLSMRLARLIVYLGAVLAVSGMVEKVTHFNIFRHLHEFIPVLVPNHGIDDMVMRGGLRVAGSLAHPIAFGTLLAMIVPLPLVLLLEAKTLQGRIKWSVISLLISVTALLTVSRTAFIGLIGVLIALAVTREKQRGVLILIGVVAAVAVHMSSPGVIGSLLDAITPSTMVERELAAGQESRLADYPRVAAEVVKKPLFGRGVGTFTADRFFFVDNQYLKYLAEIGIFGFCAELFLFIAALRMLTRRGRAIGGEQGAIVSAVGISVFVYALVNATFDAQGFPQVPYLLYTLLGIAVAIVLNAEQEVSAGPASESVSAT